MVRAVRGRGRVAACARICTTSTARYFRRVPETAQPQPQLSYKVTTSQVTRTKLTPPPPPKLKKKIPNASANSPPSTRKMALVDWRWMVMWMRRRRLPAIRGRRVGVGFKLTSRRAERAAINRLITELQTWPVLIRTGSMRSI